MNQSEMAQMVNDVNEKRIIAFMKKSADYADEDALSNFKRLNAVCKALDIDVRRSPAECALFLKMLKVDRRQNLRRRGVKPTNESVKDTLMDEHNYADLEHGCDLD